MTGPLPTTYVALLRGINVGGRNKLPMAQLRTELTDLGLQDVQTYIQTGNVLFDSTLGAAEAAEAIRDRIHSSFDLTSELVRPLVLAAPHYREVVDQAPAGFGDDPDAHRYDVAFVMGMPVSEVMPQVSVNPEVDTTWPGNRAIYYRRVKAQASRSHLSRVVSSPVYANLTIRNWNTTTRLAAMLDDR